MKKQLVRNKRAEKNLALKMALESTFDSEVQAYFNAILKKFNVFLSATDEVLPVRAFEADTVSLLEKHYKRVTRVFSTELREDLFLQPGRTIKSTTQLKVMEIDEIVTEEESQLIGAALAVIVNDQSAIRSVPINETTAMQMTESIEQARQTLLTDLSTELTQENLAKESTKLLRNKFSPRVSTLNTTETEFIAEDTKAAEAAILFGAGADQIIGTSPLSGSALLSQSRGGNKVWASVLEENTRSSHSEADGQVQQSNQPFLVQSQFLMVPGDTSLGASISNVANCQCSSLFSKSS